MGEGSYLYCIVPPEHPPPSDVVGLDGGAVRRVATGDLALWVSDLASRPSPSIDRIRRHNAVVEAAMDEAASPLPIRFGQWFTTREALLGEVAGHRERYARSLATVRGTVEFGVRIADPGRSPAPAPDPNAGTGREYMEGLARSHAATRAGEERGRRLAEALASDLEGLASRERMETLPPEEGLVSLAHLVSREVVEPYRRTVAEFAARRGDLDVRLTGPWPPYSFVE